MARLASYEGLRAVVTGASSGIGQRIALRLARDGARVVLVARRTDALGAVAAAIRAGGGEALVLPCDVADRDQVDVAADRALQHFGGVDLRVDNAGYGRHRRFLDRACRPSRSARWSSRIPSSTPSSRRSRRAGASSPTRASSARPTSSGRSRPASCGAP
jgi:NAD(P)-dependent dehydrogenase (short-subunit alcohol dehydrogenase family)